MIKIAICDDKKDQIELVRQALLSFGQRKGYDYEVSCFDNSFSLCEILDNGGKFDVLLLDICMPGIIGTELARSVRRRNDNTVIIFLSTSDEFAVDAFSLKAAHYLLKPFSQSEFDEALSRAMRIISASAQKYITVKTLSGGVSTIEVNDIQYIESFDHMLELRLGDSSVSVMQTTLSKLYDELRSICGRQFINPYKGYLVNQRSIVTIRDGNITLRCGAKIPVPRGSMRALQAEYLSYRFDKE